MRRKKIVMGRKWGGKCGGHVEGERRGDSRIVWLLEFYALATSRVISGLGSEGISTAVGNEREMAEWRECRGRE